MTPSLQKFSSSARLTLRGRLIAAAVFLVVAGGFSVLNWGERTGGIKWNRLLDPCGFKQRTRLPCPTCGMTTSVRAFAAGHVWESFREQPAAGLLCVVLSLTGAAAFVMMLTGVDGGVLKWVGGWRWRYVAVVVVIVILAAWAVTLMRAVNELR
jgi:hypothetical protein